MYINKMLSARRYQLVGEVAVGGVDIAEDMLVQNSILCCIKWMLTSIVMTIQTL